MVGEQLPWGGHRTKDEGHSPCQQWASVCEADRRTIRNDRTSVTEVLGRRHEFMYVKCLKECLACHTCTVDVNYPYDLALYVALCCAIVYKLYGVSFKASGPSTSTCLSVSSYAPGCCQAGLRNDKNETGRVPLIRLEGETPLPHMPNTPRQRGGGARRSQWSEQQGFRGGAATSSCGVTSGGGRLHRCLVLQESLVKSGTGHKNGPHFISWYLELCADIACTVI